MNQKADSLKFVMESHLAKVRSYAVVTFDAKGKLVIFNVEQGSVQPFHFKPLDLTINTSTFPRNKREAECWLRAVREDVTARLGQPTDDPVRKRLTAGSVEALAILALSTAVEVADTRPSQRRKSEIDERYIKDRE